VNNNASVASHERQLQCDWQGVAEYLADRLAGPQGRPWLAAQQSEYPLDVLHGQGIRQTEGLAQLQLGGLGDVLLARCHQIHHVAWQQAEHQEDEHRHPQEGRHEQKDAAQNVRRHARRRVNVADRCCAAPWRKVSASFVLR
jgi:hypothetical protein